MARRRRRADPPRSKTKPGRACRRRRRGASGSSAGSSPLPVNAAAGRSAGVGGAGLALGGGGVDVAPVDTEVVALLLEHRLLFRAHAEDVRPPLLARPGQRAGRLVHRQLGAVGEVNGHGVVRPSARTHVPGQVGQRPGRRRGRREGGGGERQRDVDPGGSIVDRAAWARPAGRSAAAADSWLVAHEAEGLSVDADQAREGLLLAGPVAGGVVGEPVGERPDAEIRVAGDERHGRRPERRERIGAAHVGRPPGRDVNNSTAARGRVRMVRLKERGAAAETRARRRTGVQKIGGSPMGVNESGVSTGPSRRPAPPPLHGGPRPRRSVRTPPAPAGRGRRASHGHRAASAGTAPRSAGAAAPTTAAARRRAGPGCRGRRG